MAASRHSAAAACTAALQAHIQELDTEKMAITGDQQQQQQMGFGDL